MITNLKDILTPAQDKNYAVACFNVFGYEDARAVVDSAEARNASVILSINLDMRQFMTMEEIVGMLRPMAEKSKAPVCLHLDHTYEVDAVKEAIDVGFTSVMFDGSRKPLRQNIDETAAIAEMAHAAGISCEGEIGFVGYSGGENSNGTDPEEAVQFARDSGVDAMAISVGNVHLQQDKEGGLDLARIAQIQALTTVPLVIHGGSGVPVAQRSALAAQTSVCKFNIGTELRMAFGVALRAAVASDPDRFDRVKMLGDTIDPVQQAAQHVLRAFGAPPQR